MEAVRAIKLVLIPALILFCGAPMAYAWNNVGVHPGVNELAYDAYVAQWMPYDQYMKQASLDGGVARGEAWDPQDGTSWTARISPAIREKSIKDWLISGGYSADEPELTMSLVHFYDPVSNTHHLTDLINDLPLSIGKWYNPDTDAYQWAFESADNPYSFPNGEQYYQLALADKDPDNVNYGKAWRSVGETMHLISDMTIPAHVRNDAHIPYGNLYDPLEYFTDVSDVDLYGTGYAATTDIGSYHTAYSTDSDIRTLFKKEATWTNENFFSRDTVPQYESSVSSNGKPAYSSPTVSIDPTFTGYYNRSFDGNSEFPMARASVTGLIWKTPYLVVDQNVCNAQRSILIPTSIKSSAAVLDAFLPRFQVVIDSVKPDPDKAGNYLVTAHIAHIATREWPNDLIIRNGAHIVVDSKDTIVTPDQNLNDHDKLNQLQVSVPANENSAITVYYDLGGYKITSDKQKAPAASPTPTVKPSARAATPVPTTAVKSGRTPARGYSDILPPAPYPLKTFVYKYWDNGQPREVRSYYHDEANGINVTYGPVKEYYQDGKLYTEWDYLNNPDTGSYHISFDRLYDDYGNLQYETYYGSDGEAVYMDTYDTATGKLSEAKDYYTRGEGGNIKRYFRYDRDGTLNLYEEYAPGGQVTLQEKYQNGMIINSY